MTDPWISSVDFSREQKHANITPRDAATIILIDRSDNTLKVLFGRRHAGHVFMPGALVFPGGRVDPTDHRLSVATSFHPAIAERLVQRTRQITPARVRAFGVAAIREAFEETGLCIGAFDASQPPRHSADGPFSQAGLKPDLASLHFIARAITPPRVVRRFDARFFAADFSAVTHRIPDVVGPETELVELVWMPVEQALAGKLPPITRQVLHDLTDRMANGMRPEAPVPFYTFQRTQMRREWL